MNEDRKVLNDTGNRPSMIPRTRTKQIQTTPPAEYCIETSEGWGDEERSDYPSSSDSTTSSFLLAATVPPKLRTQETSPGAVCVPGLASSFGDNPHDNLLDMEDERHNENNNSNNNAINIPSRSLTRGSVPSTAQQSQPTSMTSYDQHTSNSIPIVAELAPSYLYCEHEVEERLAERLEAQLDAQIVERLHEEVDRRFAQNDRQQVVAEVIGNTSGIDYINRKYEEVEDDFKICGIRRTWWGMILCVIMLLAIIGFGSAFFWFSQKRNGEKNIVDTLDDTEIDTGSAQPSLSPTSTIITENITIINITEIPSNLVNETAIPTLTPTAHESAAPSTAPSNLWPVERRWEYLITSIAPYVVPDNFTGIPQTYFVNDTDSSQFAALSWMAAIDVKTNIFGMPTQSLVERYVLAVLYFSTGGARTWTDSLSFLSSSNVCRWNSEHSIQKVIVGEDVRKNSTEKTADYSLLKRGVFCQNKFVTSIQLPDNSLSGLIPWELSLLENLNEMNFDTNNFYGSIPIELSRLRRLKSLWFKSNNLSGSLPTELSNAIELASIDFEDNSLTSTLPPEWSSLSNLFYISLRLNDIKGELPSEWRSLNRLNTLDLEGNQLTGTLPKEYGDLTGLEALYFESNRFEGLLPSSFGNLTRLINLYVHDNLFSGTVPSDYSALTSLKNFWFHRNLLIGSVDDIFCDSHSTFSGTHLASNCLSNGLVGIQPEIECSCCATCCDSNGRNCIENTSQ